MKKSTKGVLWSALIFPGSGQIVLNHRKRGMIFGSISVLCTIAMVVTVIRGTWTGMGHLALQGDDISIPALYTVAVDSLTVAKTYILPPMLLFWCFTVIDAWFLGRTAESS